MRQTEKRLDWTLDWNQRKDKSHSTYTWMRFLISFVKKNTNDMDIT